MKKTSTIVKGKNAYEIFILINNTAYIKSITGKTGLLNIKTGELIGELDNFYTIYDANGEFYIQRKEIEEPTKNSQEHDYTLRFYDAKEERLIADGWKLIKSFNQYYLLCAVESPIDGKIHIFDQKLCRSTINIFDIGFDSVEALYNHSNEQYLVVTLNGKKGVYREGKGLTTPVECDEIEKKTNITIFRKNNKKYFVYDGKDGKTSIEFDEIKLDEEYPHIVYCKSGNTTSVYNTNSQELLLKIDCEGIKFIVKNGDSNNDYNGIFFFSYKNNNKYGLVSAEMTPGIRKQNEQEMEAKKTILLEAKYDEITYDDGIFYLKKDDKVGLYQAGRRDVIIEPNCDNIKYLGHSYFAFYNGEYCDIAKISSSLTSVITKCKIVEEFSKSLIFERNNSFGLLECGIKRAYRNAEDFVLDNYDNIKHLGNGYFELERNGKKGISFRASVIIPLEHDEIGFHFYEKKWDNKMVYFSLKKPKTGIKLAKKRHWDHGDNEVEFVSNHIFEEIKFFEDIMVLRDKTNCFIYDYNEERMLKILPADTEISMLVREPNSYDKKILYCINGVYYFYKDGKFEESYMEECDLYVTAYESDYGVVVVNSYDKAKHDKICEQIEDGGEENFDQTLVSIYEKNPNIQEKYPTLVKRLLPSKPNNNK